MFGLEEEDLVLLEEEFTNLRKLVNNLGNKDSSHELQQLLSDNQKLKYRLNILKKAWMELSNTDQRFDMINVRGYLEELFDHAVCKAYPGISLTVQVMPASNAKFGDYQFNSAMSICQALKSQGVKSTPREVSSKILECLEADPVISKLEIAGPGFINITLTTKFIENELIKILSNGIQPPKLQGGRKKVIVDLSSPNIAKEMHVGHLRSTIIGDSIRRLLEFLGHEVLPLNHVGDWGTQFGMLLAHLENKYPEYINEPPPISDLQAFYKESKKLFDEDMQFKKKAYDYVVKLQNHDPKVIKGWMLICDISRKEFQKIYERLDILQIERGESYYQDRMVTLVKDLQDRGFLEEDEGRKVMFAEEISVPLTVVKSDGGFTYDTSDLACLKQRIEEEKANWIIYVTDAGQAQHFASVFACAQKSGFYDKAKVRVDHVGFGVVLGEDKKKFKTREGDVVRLVDLLDEGLKRALLKLREKEREQVLDEQELKAAQEAVGYGCIKYADLSHNLRHEYVFSFDRMLDDKGNTAVYLLYAYTRIKSIARSAGYSTEMLLKHLEGQGFKLEHPKELKLAKVILKFPEVLMKILEELLLHTLCDFLYETAVTFTEFYDSCYCIEKCRETGQVVKVNVDRLLLCEATASMMHQCFSILGINPVHKM